MLKVLDLFSGTQSVRKALDKMNIEYEYYGIDIYSPEEENIILDLSQDDIVNKLKEKLPKGWVPDFIWASPVCDKFSVASGVEGGNLYFEKVKHGIKIRENFKPLATSYIFKKFDTSKIKPEATFAIKLVENMNSIINHYNCDFVIENPYSSYMIYFLPPMLIKNKVNYCMYGYSYAKPTAIYSNYVLNLKTCNHKNHPKKIGQTKGRPSGYDGNIATYQERSSVPPLLIIDILKHFIGGQ